jgi:hypothetical protein
MPACHAPPPLLPGRSEVTSRRASLRVKRGENLWVPNLVNMMDTITTPVLNPELVSRYDRLYEAGRCHAADARQKTTKHGVLFELLASVDAESHDCTFTYLIQKFGLHLNYVFVFTRRQIP